MMNDAQGTTSATNGRNKWLAEQWDSFFRWLGRQVGPILAVFIIYYIGSPIAYFAINHLKKDINELFPSTVTTTELEETRRNPTQNVYNQGYRSKQKGVKKKAETVEKDAPHIQKKEVTRTESMVARVWTYALRTFGLLAALGITAWAAVTLAKTD